jgi:hypothetical protein
MLSSAFGLIIAVLGVLAGISALLSEELDKNKSLKFGLVGIMTALVIYALAGSLLALNNTQSESSSRNKEEHVVPINSAEDWQDTGLVLKKGDNVSIRVVAGKWTASRYSLSSDNRVSLPDDLRGAQIWVNRSYENSGDGGLKDCADFSVPNCPVPSAKVGTLVRKTGIAEPFAVGSSNAFFSEVDGPLYLRINDGEKIGSMGLDDNYGVLIVKISRRT